MIQRHGSAVKTAITSTSATKRTMSPLPLALHLGKGNDCAHRRNHDDQGQIMLDAAHDFNIHL